MATCGRIRLIVPAVVTLPYLPYLTHHLDHGFVFMTVQAFVFQRKSPRLSHPAGKILLRASTLISHTDVPLLIDLMWSVGVSILCETWSRSMGTYGCSIPRLLFHHGVHLGRLVVEDTCGFQKSINL